MGTRVPSTSSGVVVATYHNMREVPAGTIGGGNVTFTMSRAPMSSPDSVMVFHNGLKLVQGTDYSYSGQTITFVVAPLAGDTVEVYYAAIF